MTAGSRGTANHRQSTFVRSKLLCGGRFLRILTGHSQTARIEFESLILYHEIRSALSMKFTWPYSRLIAYQLIFTAFTEFVFVRILVELIVLLDD